MESPKLPPPKSVILCLSGGGLRATYFHLGVIRTLRKFGLLDAVTDIISVSGGSIAAAHLAQNWPEYTGSAEDFDKAQANLLLLRKWDLRGRAIRRSILWWPLYFLSLHFPRVLGRLRMSRTEALRLEYEKFFRPQTIEQLDESLPERPQFHFASTNLATGSASSFNRQNYQTVEDDVLTGYPAEQTKLSLAVAASSAFPPVFPPILFDESRIGAKVRFRVSPHVLTDGGVYDNTGYETASLVETERKAAGFALSDLIVVSDAGSSFQLRDDSEFTNPIGLALRASEVLMNRASAETLKRIVSQNKIVLVSIDEIDKNESLAPMIQKEVSEIRTDMDRFSDSEVVALVTHGMNKAERRLLDRLSEVGPSQPVNEFPIALSSSVQLSKRLSRSNRVRWWNTFTNFHDWRTTVILIFVIGAGLVPLVGTAYLSKSVQQRSSEDASRNQIEDFQSIINALRLQLSNQAKESDNEIERLRRALTERSRPTYQQCRSPAHGPSEGFAVDKTITKESGWRPGGYNQDAWCRDAETEIRAQFADAIVQKISSSEDHRSTCGPFNCTQYKYVCTLRVQAQPIYPLKASPACPLL